MAAHHALAFTIASLCWWQGAVAQAADLTHFRERYEGHIVWIHDGRSQNIYLEIASERVNRARGLVIAQGWERYDVGGRCASVEIEITVEPRIGQFIMQRKPMPSDRAQDSAVVDPVVGVMSADFRQVVNDLGQNPDQHEDFVFRAVPVAQTRPEERHRATGSSVASSVRPPGC